tara:strand:- start:1081 stop:1740 length:660 start_codon:yes stop_codon:yes gene_type:complete
MKQIIRQVLNELGDTQVNLGSEAARETIASLVTVALKDKGEYTEFTEEYKEALKAKETWVCSICGKNTYDVDYDYIGTGTNHLGCELEDEQRNKPVTMEEAANIEVTHDQGGSYVYGREKKTWPGLDAIKGNTQKQIYNEMTADGLPPGGDTQAVLESHKLADEIVDNQEGEWIYESPDRGKTVFRRPFGDYDMKKKEEVDWPSKEPTGRKFTDYPFKD